MYTPREFNPASVAIIDHANTIIAEYAAQGFDLTLRQLFYQFVSRDLLPNTQPSYKRLGRIISDARRAGLIDWDWIVDRTRFVRRPSSWDTPADIVATCARTFDVDWWREQPYRPEVFIEKDALIGVLEAACEAWHCPYFSCRGYVSDSEIWAASQRMDRHIQGDQIPIVFHLGDHDPSGIDMTRDIRERLNLFSRESTQIEVKRLALTMAQVEEYNPPANPAKETDIRFAGYQEQFGDESWELDALSPTVIAQLIATAIEELVDRAAWSASEAQRDEGRRLLGVVSNDWEEIVDGR
jgi:hypothetical protein